MVTRLQDCRIARWQEVEGRSWELEGRDCGVARLQDCKSKVRGRWSEVSLRSTDEILSLAALAPE